MIYFMKRIVRLRPNNYVHLDSYGNGTRFNQLFSNFLIVAVFTGISFVVTGAILGTDLTKPLLQWSHQQNTSPPLR